MNAAFMSSQQHERGIHALRSGAGEASVTKVRFRARRDSFGDPDHLSIYGLKPRE
jgi:hypothetical protein